MSNVTATYKENPFIPKQGNDLTAMEQNRIMESSA
jgi:hypothetical protein